MTLIELRDYFKRRQKEEYREFMHRMVIQFAKDHQFVTRSLICTRLGLGESETSALMMYMVAKRLMIRELGCLRIHGFNRSTKVYRSLVYRK